MFCGCQEVDVELAQVEVPASILGMQRLVWKWLGDTIPKEATVCEDC